jgi:hypothetical protein
MADWPVFDWVSGELERRTEMSRLEARGTVRLVLKDAGLDPATVTVTQMSVVIERLLAAALARRRVEEPEELCKVLRSGLEVAAANGKMQPRESAYDVFRRFGIDDEEDQ